MNRHLVALKYRICNSIRKGKMNWQHPDACDICGIIDCPEEECIYPPDWTFVFCKTCGNDEKLRRTFITEQIRVYKQKATMKIYETKKPKAIDPEKVEWLLQRIYYISDGVYSNDRRCTKKDIFRGSYDVFYSDSDRAKYDDAMNERLADARHKGFIINDSGRDDINWTDNWSLTDAGKEELFNYESKNI